MGSSRHAMECGAGKQFLGNESGEPVVYNALEDHGEEKMLLCHAANGPPLFEQRANNAVTPVTNFFAFFILQIDLANHSHFHTNNPPFFEPH